MANPHLKNILTKEFFEKEDIRFMLEAEGLDKAELFKYAAEIKRQYVGDEVYLRGLIEYSNICKKDCYYCGIRCSNKNFNRYEVSIDEIKEACDFAIKNRFGSMVIQSGELQSENFTEKILKAILLIKNKSNGKMRITLSCGEQTPEVYKKWFDAGAERYLLRIEASNPELYKKLHPENKLHSYDQRVESLKQLKAIGFQTGTGVMIGLPFQTINDLADDILFMRDFDIDMCGMGPYIEHESTPLYKHTKGLISLENRYQLALKMIAVLRIVMKDVNIASTTALQAINASGKKCALEIGANVIMPNITPVKYKEEYHLYKDKPGEGLSVDNELDYAIKAIKNAGCEVAFGSYGDALHYLKR